MTLARHLSRLMAMRILAALLALVAILQVLDLLDATSDILDRGLGVGGLLTYAALRLPRLIQQALPLAVLTGALFGFAQLARENAVTALRATGMSVYRLTALAAPPAAGAVVLGLLLSLWLAPAADGARERWWRESAPVAERTVGPSRAFRIGDEIVTASLGDATGTRLTGLTLHRRDTQGRLLERIRAYAAIHTPGGWRLEGVMIDRLAPAPPLPTLLWAAALKPSDIRGLFAREPAVSAATARRALSGGFASRPSAVYRTQLQRLWAGSAAALVMLILAAPAALAGSRNRTAPLLAVGSLAAGLMFLVVDGALTAVGESGVAPAFLAAWAAPVIFTVGGVTALLYLEG